MFFITRKQLKKYAVKLPILINDWVYDSFKEKGLQIPNDFILSYDIGFRYLYIYTNYPKILIGYSLICFEELLKKYKINKKVRIIILHKDKQAHMIFK